MKRSSSTALAAALAVCGLCAAPGSAQEAGDTAAVNTFDNAAVDYWKAAALMQPVRDAEGLAARALGREALLSIGPPVLQIHREEARWLLGDRAMLAALHEARDRAFCAFHPPGASGAPRDAGHYLTAARLVQRALPAAAALEFIEQDEATARVYADLLHLLDGLDEDLLWASADQSVSLLPPLVHAIEGFCARQPTGGALVGLGDYLAGIARPRFPLRAYLRKEAEFYRSWLLDEPARSGERLAALYGNQPLPLAADKLLLMDAQDRNARLRAWVEEYTEDMRRLDEVIDRPYGEAVRVIREMDEQIERLTREADGETVNPLLPLLMKPFEQTYERFLAAEGLYTMLDILVAATGAQALTGEWPRGLEDVERFAGRTFPPDPFSGKPIRYSLSGRMPLVRMDAPGWIEEQTALPVELRLRERLERSMRNFQEYQARHQAEQQRRGAEVEAVEEPVAR